MTRQFTFWRVLALAFFCSVVGFGSIIFSRRPSNSRIWATDHAYLPEIVLSDSLARIINVRDFQYRTLDDFEARWETRTYDLSKLETAWFVLTPFSRSWRGPAHSFVSFGFSDSTYVAVSIEARREIGENYGVFRGLGRNYELIYVIGDEEDLIGKRAAFGDFDVYLYPIRTTPEKARAVFLELLHRADAVRNHPEFYNTITNSCTSNLVAAVNRVAPQRISSGIKLIFPGYADDVARSLGLIDSTITLEQARTRYRINDQARAALGHGDFSRAIRRPKP